MKNNFGSFLRGLVLLVLPFAAATCLAQFSSAVQGNVLDPSGAAIPNATVTLENVETHVTQTAKSDSAGVYRFVSLPPGHYTVSATPQGFSGSKVDFVLQTAENRDVPLKLAVGNAASSVTVTTQAPLLDTSDSRNQYTIDTQALQQLPLANRNATAVIGITPGVTGALDVQNNTNYNPETYIDASANGRGENGNMYVVDGLDVTSNIRPGVINLTPSADTVQEVSVQANTYGVEYGRASGIETLITTKPGTDRFHGVASEYYTYQKWAARGEFGPSYKAVPNAPPYHTNNMSFAVGGPILRKQKLFFFASLQPYHKEGSSYGTVFYEDPAFVSFAQQARPNSPELQLLTKYPVGNVIFGSVTQTAQAAFGPTNASKNTGCGTPGTDNIPCATPVFDMGTFNSATYNHARQYSVRIDKYFDKDRLYGNFIRNTIVQSGSNPRPAFGTTSNYYGFSLQGNETHTFNANTLNEAIFGYNRIQGISPSTGLFTVPIVNVGGLGAPWGDLFAQNNFTQLSYHWRDVLSHIHGSHSFKFGYEGWHGHNPAYFQSSNSIPLFNFNNMIDLINNNPYNETSLSYNPLTGTPEPANFSFSITTGGVFAEDTWKATKRLTLNYGLRYDNFGNPYPSLAGTIGAPFFLGSGSTFAERIANGFIKTRSQLLNQEMNWNFSPRIGAAWDTTGDGRWIVHGGVGIYHDQVTAGTASLSSSNPPNYVVPTFFNNGSTAAPIFGYGTQNKYPFGFPYPAFAGQVLNAKGGIEGAQINIASLDANVHSPTTYNWSAAVEHPLTRDLVASAGYVGSHSSGVLLGSGQQGAYQFGYDVNAYAGDLIQHTTCDSQGVCQGVQTRLNTSFGAIQYAYNSSRANYSALIVGVRGRINRRGFVTASYTRSVSKDNATYYTPAVSLDSLYGNSPYDFPNRFSLGGSYQLPGVANGNGLLKRATGGWSVSGTVTLQSGAPMVIFTSAPYAVQLINPSLTAAASNLQFKPNSGDFNADGYNYDFPNVDPHFHIPHSRASYKNGVFPKCVATTGSDLNACGGFTLPAFGQEGNEKINAQFRNPGFAETDATLMKSTPLAEGINLDLRFDAFNAFNQVNFYPVDQNANNGTFGQAITTHTPRYLQVGATLRF